MKKVFAALSAVLMLAVGVAVVPALAATKSKTVTLKADEFSPSTLKVKKGTKIVWKFADHGTAHNVTVDVGPKKFHSADKSTGTYTQTLTKAGEYHIICTIHINEGMQATIDVK